MQNKPSADIKKEGKEEKKNPQIPKAHIDSDPNPPSLLPKFIADLLFPDRTALLVVIEIASSTTFPHWPS